MVTVGGTTEVFVHVVHASPVDLCRAAQAEAAPLHHVHEVLYAPSLERAFEVTRLRCVEMFVAGEVEALVSCGSNEHDLIDLTGE